MNPRDLKRIVVVAAILCIGLSGKGVRAVSAQAAKEVAKVEIPLKVTVVIARYTGDKKTASLPFTLTVITNDQRTSLRMGADVPIPSGSAQSAYSYRSLGTNIDCGANTRDDGRYRLLLTITDSQIFTDPKAGAGVIQSVPSFQSFTSTTALVLADGQSTQFTTATDKVSGEVVKVDVTLNVVK
jgi:hypothetical protein